MKTPEEVLIDFYDLESQVAHSKAGDGAWVRERAKALPQGICAYCRSKVTGERCASCGAPVAR